MRKTKSGEIECVFLENYIALLQPDPENARQLARIPQWANEEPIKRGYPCPSQLLGRILDIQISQKMRFDVRSKV